MGPVAIVQHEESVPPGLIAEVLEETGTEHVVIEAWRADGWPAVGGLGGLVVMGGTMNVDETDRYPFLARSRALMADALDRELPTLGVCLGSQMMARVLGADVFRADPRNAFFGEVELTPQGADDEIVQSFDSVPVLQFHEDTFKVPDGAFALASSATSGLAQAFRYRDTAYAVQFHFEVDHDIVSTWCDEIGDDAMVQEWGIATETLMADADKYMSGQRAAGKTLVGAFLRLARV
ncbi:MAG: type 1 glutamine amidotransferase [Actinomycetota bacterium]